MAREEISLLRKIIVEGLAGPEIGLSEGTYLTYNSINFRWI